MIYAIAAVVVLILDQAVKYWTINHIPLNAMGEQCVSLIPGVLHMTNVQNTGAAFSILANAKWLLIGVSALFIIVIIVLINTEIIRTKFGRWTSVLVAAGALGNCIDRVLFGYVVDMFEFEIFSFAVFNVADIFITVCGLLFCIHVIVYRDPMELPKEEKRRPAKAKARRRQPRRSELDMEEAAYYEDEEPIAEPEPTPEQPQSRRAARQAARQAIEDKYAAIPHRDRGEHRSLADELRPADPDDPFAEWTFGGDAEEKEAPAPKAEEPAPAAPEKPVKSAPAEKAPEAPAAPAKAETPKAEEPKKAAPAKKPDLDPGFDAYSLDDILAEFRDS